MSEQDKERRIARDLPPKKDVKGGGGADNQPLAELLPHTKEKPATSPLLVKPEKKKP